MEIVLCEVSNMIKASLLGLIFAVATLGNIFVAYIFIKHRKVLLEKRPTYQFILNVILSDLVVGVLTIPFELVRELLGSWIFGETPCKIVEFIIVPAVVSSPYIYKIVLLEVDTKIICTPQAIPVKWLDKLYESMNFIIAFLLPFGVLCWCYFRVILIMWGCCPRVSVASSPSTQLAILQSRKRVTRTACLVTGAFILCWLPTFILNIVRIAYGTAAIRRGHVLYEIAVFGAFTNEAINPVIYCAFDTNIKMRIRPFCCVNNSNESSAQGERTLHTTDRDRQEIYARNLELRVTFLTLNGQ